MNIAHQIPMVHAQPVMAMQREIGPHNFPMMSILHAIRSNEYQGGGEDGDGDVSDSSSDDEDFASHSYSYSDSNNMKIDRSRLRKSSSEVPPECQALIDRLCACSRDELLDELSKINTWTFGKCELYHWTTVLDIFDDILEEAATPEDDSKWALYCDIHYNPREKKLLLWTLHFTTLLIEHSFSRHLYSSMEHLLALLTSSDMSVVLGVLNLLYMFSKRSNFITRLPSDRRSCLISRLQYLAESWGGKENGFGLADCCDYKKPIPSSATTLHLELHKFTSKEQKEQKNKTNTEYIHVENVDQLHKTPAELMVGLLSLYAIPPEKEMLLFTHVRLALNFSNYKTRLLCVLARLQALSVLVYSNALQESAHTLLYNGLLEELVELIELKLPHLVEIRSAALRTLTSIIHLDRNPHFPKKPGSRLANIIDVTGANQYHGFLPVLVRNCIASLTKQTSTSTKEQPGAATPTTELPPPPPPDAATTPQEEEYPFSDADFLSDVGISSQIGNDWKKDFPLPLATALFSFLYHLASYEVGGDALVSCGMMESLLQVINWHGVELEHITFVTRAVRVIDLITNIDMQAFHSHGGLQSFINRLDIEIGFCVQEHSYEFKTNTQDGQGCSTTIENPVYEEDSLGMECQYFPANSGKTCLPQRAALLKSMLNFLKKALQDSTFSENIRHLMEGTLPHSLKHIISNAEYYGPSLFLLATDVVTVYVFQEPSLLSTLQDNGLTDVVLHALLIKDVPATREVLSSLPHVFTALCLNNRGLQSFVKCKPFERLFKVLLSPNYLPAMRRRRSSDPLGDTASNLGNAMDELMRHQPSLKVDATGAIIKLLQELCQLGSDPKYVCWRPHSKQDPSPSTTSRPAANAEGSSDEEDDDEEEASTSSHNQAESQEQAAESERTPIALVDYILNVMKFIDAILSNNSTDDHCREFVNQGGLVPLLKILGLPNLPVDCPITTSSQAVASVCKSILNLAQEPKVLEEGLMQLNEVLKSLRPLYTHSGSPSGSKLLQELVGAANLDTAFSTPCSTPLLHAMGAAHGYVLMFVHVCRTGQNDIRTTSLQHWGADLGLTVLKGLAELYTSLVWESTLLLALCSDDVIPYDSDFGRDDMEKLRIALLHKVDQRSPPPSSSASTVGTFAPSDTSRNVTCAMEHLTTDNHADTHKRTAQTQTAMDVDVSSRSTSEASTSTSYPRPNSQQIAYIKPLLGASSRLGRALAELFGLLVKLCVGSPTRMRRGQNVISSPHFTTPYARNVATALNLLLARGLNCKVLPPSPIPKFRLTFLICSVGFTSPMLFDEKKFPYHLMLQKFVALGGQAAFFNTFKWALSAGDTIPLEEGLEHKDLPDGTGEFLDVWLVLLEKMVNPKSILESPHVVTSKPHTVNVHAFDPLKYVIQIHKLAFEAVMYMWGKTPLRNYGLRMTESMLSILKHILRGEKNIRERLSKVPENKLESSSSPSTSGAGPSTSNNDAIDVSINSENLRQLMDMGFSHEHAIEALMQTSNIEQATEYLLSNRDLALHQMEVELSEDDQMMQAIAMSLGDNADGTEKEKEKKEPVEDNEPLSRELIDNFSYSSIYVCLKLIETLPECIHKASDLLVAIMKRNGDPFRDLMLDKILTEIIGVAKVVIASMEKTDRADPALMGSTYLEGLQTQEMHRLGYYTHLFTLFFEIPSYVEMRIPCGFAVHRQKVIPFCIRLITLTQELMTKTKKTEEPKWLTPVLLLIDSYCKVAICTQRKRDMHLVTRRLWKWYDIVTGKWTPYSPNNNTQINDAYWSGEQSIRVTCGRRRYTVTFNNMMQMNDESGNNRPISMTPINLSRDYCHDFTKDSMDKDEVSVTTLTTTENDRCIPVPSLPDDDLEIILNDCLKLMQLQIDKNLLHAILRVCVRLTRSFHYARLFVHGGGVKALLKMRQLAAFTGYEILSTILIRHTLEEPQTLAYAMEKVLRARTLVSIPPPYKELMYLTRQIGGAVTRNPEIFFSVAKDILRVEYTVYGRGDDVDVRLPLRCDQTVRSPTPPLEDDICIEVIYELLNALLLPIEYEISDFVIHSNTSRATETSSAAMPPADTVYQRASDLLGSAAAGADELFQDTPESPSRSNTSYAIKEPGEHDLAMKPLLGKHAIIKMLADAVVSYGPAAKLITEYTFKATVTDVILEDCTALAFIFDKLLPINENLSDRDVSNMCRMLIAAISSCNHSNEAQASLVNEVKAALNRALLLPETSDKHNQVQLICGIITTMIENCPPTHPRAKNQPLSGQMNNIVRLMLRKGIVTDLARVAHCLDMSSPNFAVTMNAALKPLEALTRIVNQPVQSGSSNKNKKSHQTVDVSGATQSGTTSTEATNAQGEEAAEDTENTEHDVSAVASSLEANPSNQADETDNLLEIMDQLLERAVNDTNTSSHNHAMDIDDDGIVRYEHERDATEEMMSTDSGDSDSNASDQDVQDDDNDDNEADDEDIDVEEVEDNNSDEDENNSSTPNIDRDEDILMIQYTDNDGDGDGLPLVRRNENGFAIPIFEDVSGSNEASGSGPVTHPLLTFRHSSDNGTSSGSRSQRINRSRRYQYLTVNPRTQNNPPGPVILQRLLGPTALHSTLGPSQLFAAPSSIHDTPRVLIMDNFSLFPSSEEHIDFVDQAGFLFGPTVAATINHVTSLLYWWNEESKVLDVESTYDCTTYICNKLIPSLMKHRNAELLERRQKKQEEEKRSGKAKQKSDDSRSRAELEQRDVSTPVMYTPRLRYGFLEGCMGTADRDRDSGDSNPSQEPPSLSFERLEQNLRDNLRESTPVAANNSSSNDSNWPSDQAFNADPENPDGQDSSSYEFSIDSFNFQDLAVPLRPSVDPVMMSEREGITTIDLDEDPDDDDDEEEVHQTVRFFRFPESTTQTDENTSDSVATTASAPPPEDPPPPPPEDQPPEPPEPPTEPPSDSPPPPPPPTSSSDEPMAEASGPSTSHSDDIPEGVDPSFLDALPPDMRTEVLEQHRLLRLQQRISASESAAEAAGSSVAAAGPSGSTEVSPEFLAALPPSLQEEVLTQQRLEQQRQLAARVNPNEPVDAGAFFETLQPSLRTMILSDMEDSQMSALPPDLAAEAQTLRRDWEARNRQIVQERFLQSNLTTIIRHSTRGRLGSRFSNFLPQRAQWNSFGGRDIIHAETITTSVRVRGRQLLDHEALSCLLVLLFADSPHLNKLRLHRVIRNLCYHGPTREWIVRSLLSIIDKSVHSKPEDHQVRRSKRTQKPGPLTRKLMTDTKVLANGANWLNIRMEAALGCHANVFIVNRPAGKRSDKSNPPSIVIHHQAAPVICRNALDLFISLSKSFPSFLLPLKPKEDNMSSKPGCSKTKSEGSDFWDMLLKLDSSNVKKGKSLAKTQSNLSLCSESDAAPSTFEQSIFGQLLSMLSSPVIYRNTQLTDNLLRLLSVITMGLPELSKGPGQKSSKNKQKLESMTAPENALNLAVNVLTYKSCSEEGLEYVTTLLLNLSNCSLEMSYMILELLLSGAVRIGEAVREQIQKMLDELRRLNKVQKRALDEPQASTSKGILSNRFTKENVVITASKKVKASCDLQLPSMAPLTSKTSSQVFFLRVLRVIVQIRDAIKKAQKKEEEERAKKRNEVKESLEVEMLEPDLLGNMQINALSDQLTSLEALWETLSQCLLELEHTPDHHAVLVLQPAVEAFFLVHSPQQGSADKPSTAAAQDLDNQQSEAETSSVRSGHDEHSSDSSKTPIPVEHMKFLTFAEKHRTVLNQILRQTTAHLADGPFSVLVDHTRVLDFDVKRRYFRTELERLDQGIRREETAVHVRRSNIFEDSFRELYRRSPEEWKNRFYIVFEDEEGQDAGGLLREWYVIISRDIFNPMYALFTVSPGDRVTYMINPASHYNPNHLCYYKFVGRVIAKAIYDNKLLECYFTRSFYKHILGIPVKYTDMESEDYSFYRGLVYLMENNINNLGLDLTFSTEINEFGVTETRDLIPNGRNVPVTEDNKMEYVRLSCQMKMTGAIRQQLNAFLEGFYDIIPKRLISIFNEQELELLISGLPNVDIEDLRTNTEYHKYQANSLQIQWFWRALRSFDQAERAKFLQFVTGTSKVPLQGFGALEGMNGVQKFQIHRDDRSTDRLPSAHTCFNQLDLPVYETYDKLRSYLLKAIHECSEGFGFA